MDKTRVRKNTLEFVYGDWSSETQQLESFMTGTKTNNETELDISDQISH